MAETLLVRADAGVEIGIGHVMRCLALAQAWQDRGGDAVFLAHVPEPIADRLRREGMGLESPDGVAGGATDLERTQALAAELGARRVVVDGYRFLADFQRELKKAELRVLWIDDHGHATDYCADLVLNQNLHAEPVLYPSRANDTGLLLGPRFALLRREFLGCGDWVRTFPPLARRLLVTLGGSGSKAVSLLLLDAIASLGCEGLETRIVAGPASPHRDLLEQRAGRTLADLSIVTAGNEMPEMMRWADTAISAAGSTSWELAYLGVPSLLVALAPNQVPLAESMSARGASRHLDDSICSSPERLAEMIHRVLSSAEIRTEMSRRAADLVDGEGAARVTMRLRDERLRLRPAQSEDRELLWHWANDREVRRQSFSPDAIPWEVHVDWSDNRIENPDCLLLVALDCDDFPLGQVRFDLTPDGEAEMSISLGERHRGQGYGAELIEIAVDHLFNSTSARIAHAYVRPENHASIATFVKARFELIGKDLVRGTEALHFRRRDDQEEAR